MYISDSIAILTNILINTYFKNFYCSVVITDTKLSLKNTEVPLIFFETKEHDDFPFLFEVMDKGCHGYVLRIKNLNQFFTQFENVTLYINHRYGRKRFIILPTDEADFSLNNFNYDWVKHIPDVILLKSIIVTDNRQYVSLQSEPGDNQQSETIIIDNQQSISFTEPDDSQQSIRLQGERDGNQQSKATDRKKSDLLNKTVNIEESIPKNNRRLGIFSMEKLTNIEIHSFNYVGTENMKDLVLHDIWFGENQTFQQKAVLFPDKMRDLKGRTLRLSTINYKPSSLWWEDKDGVHLDGTEARIAIQYCKWVNCKIELVHFEEELEWGEMFENRTGVGLLGNVYHDRVDVGFSSSCMWFHEYTFLDLSAPYIRTGITVIAPRPKLINDFLFPFLPFKMNIWILHNIVLLLATILLYIYCVMESTNQTPAKAFDKSDNFEEKPTDGNALGTINNNFTNEVTEANETTIYRVKGKKRFESNANSFKGGSFVYNMMGSHLSILDILFLQGGGFGGGRRGLVLRSAMLFYALFVCNAYTCGLTSTMTRQRYSAPIDSVRDLAAHGTRWGATHDAWIFSIRAATQKDLITVRNNFVNMPPKELMKQWKRDDFAYAVERLQHGNFATADYITTDNVNLRRLMGGDIYWDWYITMFRKSSPFRPHYDTLIWRLHQTGLMKAWEYQVVSKYLNYAVQQAVIRSRALPSNPPTVLGLHHVQGALLLWGTLLVGALATFLVELAVQACRRPV